jgi:phosphocarrier protein
VNQQGLHARPIMKFVDLASSFTATLTVEKNGEQVDGKSPMEMMLLEAPLGSRLHIRANGDDAQAMVDALRKLVADGFGEE